MLWFNSAIKWRGAYENFLAKIINLWRKKNAWEKKCVIICGSKTISHISSVAHVWSKLHWKRLISATVSVHLSNSMRMQTNKHVDLKWFLAFWVTIERWQSFKRKINSWNEINDETHQQAIKNNEVTHWNIEIQIFGWWNCMDAQRLFLPLSIWLYARKREIWSIFEGLCAFGCSCVSVYVGEFMLWWESVQ